MKKYVELMRLPFLTVTIGGVLIGTAYAYWKTGNFSFLRFFLALLAASFLHAATNVANDYFDYISGNDPANVKAISPFSGGSRKIVTGEVKPREALIFSIILALAGGIIGLYLNFTVEGNLILYIGIIGVFLVFSYNGIFPRFVYIGLGEFVIFLAWGPLMVAGAYAVQTGKFTPELLWVSFLPGILTALILVINEFADEEADRKVGRRTWVILFGRAKTMDLYLFFTLLAYGLTFCAIILKKLPVFSAAVVVALILGIKAYSHGKIKVNSEPAEFLPAVLNTINHYNLAALLLTASLIAGRLLT